MDSKDKKEINKMFGQVVDEKIIPRLKKLEEKSDATMEALAETKEDVSLLKEDVSLLKEDVSILKEDFNDMGYTVERIETKLDASIRRQDDSSIKISQLNRRVLKLEAKKTNL